MIAKQDHLLVVDDNKVNRMLLLHSLEQQGHCVTAAVNGREALEFLHADPFDLVLLDIEMPEMDGYQVLSAMKQDLQLCHIPVIMVTSVDEIESAIRCIEMGAEDYLPKPFNPVLLRARIGASLEKKHLRDKEQLYLHSLERELEIGREIQMGFLPSELPQVDGWEIAAYFKSAREVAGDFYDAFTLPDGNLVCVIGDVCGKGVGAALFMTLFRSLIRATSTADTFSNRKAMLSLTPSERLLHVISFTNNYVAETHGDANMFATVFIGLINLQDGRLSYINCGNEPALLLKHGVVIDSLRPTGPVIGVIPDARFSVKEISMESRDLLLVFTDGIPDALNVDNVSFGNERMLKLLGGSQASPAQVLKNIENELLQFIGAAEQFDDITLLAVKRKA
jgi:sigma-B regulation protein RsbU (phosphoserine phosphatase)